MVWNQGSPSVERLVEVNTLPVDKGIGVELYTENQEGSWVNDKVGKVEVGLGLKTKVYETKGSVVVTHVFE